MVGSRRQPGERSDGDSGQGQTYSLAKFAAHDWPDATTSRSHSKNRTTSDRTVAGRSEFQRSALAGN